MMYRMILKNPLSERARKIIAEHVIMERIKDLVEKQSKEKK